MGVYPCTRTHAPTPLRGTPLRDTRTHAPTPLRGTPLRDTRHKSEHN